MSSNDDTAQVHPGKVLADELADLDISCADFAAALSIPLATAEALLAQRIGITPELTLRISHYFGTTARFWTDLQDAYDLHVAKRKHGAAIAAQIKPLPTKPIPIAGESEQAAGSVFGNDSYIALRQGAPGDLAALADAWQRTALGFFITPDNSLYLALGLAVSFAILGMLMLSWLWRGRQINKDLAMLRELAEAEAS